MAGKGKRYAEAIQKVDRDHLYSPREAVKVLKEVPSAKFDETVELSIRLGVDPRKPDQQVRGAISLPRGTGKTMRVAVITQGAKAKEAEEAGADVVGAEDLATRIEGGWLDFDALVASPDMMPAVGKLGRVLGPRGLMPNPKSGTVTDDVAKAVKDIKGGQVEYRTDKHGNLHIIMGKKSFEGDALIDNYAAIIDEIYRVKPAAAKGRYLKSVTMATTMGPGIRIDPQKSKDLAEEMEGATA
ncbi:MAG: large subunit ribosomal protein [Actinomycetota bacterium]|jgi:large subunit ribosomal protein L1|nr:large subunit ribosomal protein [Actinomycetota bacterium]